jgi:hypothetical protein
MGSGSVASEEAVHDFGGFHFYYGYGIVEFESVSVLDVFLF